MFPPRAAVATTWHFEAGTASPRALPNRECLLVPAPERGPQQRELLLSFKLHTSSSANASAWAGGEPLPTPSSTRARITLAPNRYYKSPPAHLLRHWGLPPATPGFVRSALLSTPGGLPSEQGWWRASPPADTFPAEPPGGRKGWLQRKLGALARLTLSRVHGFGRPQGTVAAPSCVGSTDCQILAVSLLPGAGVGCGRDMRASGAADLRRACFVSNRLCVSWALLCCCAVPAPPLVLFAGRHAATPEPHATAGLQSEHWKLRMRREQQRIDERIRLEAMRIPEWGHHPPASQGAPAAPEQSLATSARLLLLCLSVQNERNLTGVLVQATT